MIVSHDLTDIGDVLIDGGVITAIGPGLLGSTVIDATGADEFGAVTSTNIAQILNIYAKKGAIAVGADGDIVVFDPNTSKTIAAATRKCAIDYNVLEGVIATGLPRYTLSRVTVLWGPDGGQPQPGHGQHLVRPANPPVSRACSQWRDLIAPRAVVRDEGQMPIGV